MFQRHYKNWRTEGWKDTLMGKGLTTQAWRPELGSPLPRFKINGVDEYICNPSTGGRVKS